MTLSLPRYPPEKTNIAGWKMDPDWRCISVFLFKMGDILASYVSLPEGNLSKATGKWMDDGSIDDDGCTVCVLCVFVFFLRPKGRMTFQGMIWSYELMYGGCDKVVSQSVLFEVSLVLWYAFVPFISLYLLISLQCFLAILLWTDGWVPYLFLSLLSMLTCISTATYFANWPRLS